MRLVRGRSLGRRTHGVEVGNLGLGLFGWQQPKGGLLQEIFAPLVALQERFDPLTQGGIAAARHVQECLPLAWVLPLQRLGKESFFIHESIHGTGIRAVLILQCVNPMHFPSPDL